MLWEVEILPKGPDLERERVCEEFNLITHTSQGADHIRKSAHGYLLEGELTRTPVARLVSDLLVDSLVENGRIGLLQELHPKQLRSDHDEAPDLYRDFSPFVTVLLKPGVMDPVSESVLAAARDLGIPLQAVRTFRRYYINFKAPFLSGVTMYGDFRCPDDVVHKILANDAIEQVIHGPLSLEHLGLGSKYSFALLTMPLRQLDDAALSMLSRERQLSLNLAELRAIQEHFRSLDRDPTDVELETLAQTWSEHCSHKTLKGTIEFDGRRYENLLKETIFGATQEIRRRLGADDWCVSVFEDNAGVVRFDDRYNVCFKVETHNHPSAIEPYGGANTGLGGVIRDPLGTGLGAQPICNTDVFCFAPPDTPPETLPPGVLHPRKVLKGVVAGVRDYGNRMGIATVNGAVCFDERYLANPLVFCGTVGLIPVDRCHKEPRAGDLIVVVGGRTGRDGIHGATFSSVGLTSESEKVSGGAVQIGNAITEKKLLDVLLQARDQGQYHSITDCGAGGFSSAVGEMGEPLGASVHLDRAPLKYEGLSYAEIWISESQERMVLAVPPDKWLALQKLCASEDVEATAIGTFEATGKLKLFYQDNQVADLEMCFLHHGRPPLVRQATWRAGGVSPLISARLSTHSEAQAIGGLTPPVRRADYTDILFKILSSYNVCSKEWIIRQYDHEVQGRTVIKPLVGVRHDGPGDAAVITPVLGSWAGMAIGCGINPRYGDLDPYWMAASAIDEAVRNVVAVGADPARIALLDNFCWGNTDRPEALGSLVRAAEACRDVAIAFGMPFISGKDSLYNEYHSGDRHITIPPTLLISALGRVPDVRRCVTIDLKEPGNLLFLVGCTRNELGGSHFNLVNGIEGGIPPQVDLEQAPRIFRKVHEAMQRGLIRSCHDLSEGGLAVALAEMCLAGGLGAHLGVRLMGCDAEGADLDEETRLFSESNTRLVIEVTREHAGSLAQLLDSIQCCEIGEVMEYPMLQISGTDHDGLAISASLKDLKEAWQKPLRW